DVIYIADGEGITLRVSDASTKIWGHSLMELEGKSVYDLGKKGVFRPSVIRLVLEAKHQISSLQTTKTGHRLIILGIPIKDAFGNINQVINVSKDITEVSNLQKELHETKSIIKGYKEELISLREKKGVKNRLVYNSPSMRKVVSFAKKAAFSNSPILVTGESGVGKRLLCEFIHNYSDRSSNSILIINCSAISEQEFREKVNITQFGDEMNTSHIGYKMQYG